MIRAIPSLGQGLVQLPVEDSRIPSFQDETPMTVSTPLEIPICDAMGKSSVGSILWFYVSYALCAKGAHGTATGEVQVLVGSNFSSSIGDGLELPWFVEFYSPNCGHCKRLAPIWEQLAGLLQGQVAVAKVDATEEEGLADEWDVTGLFRQVTHRPKRRQGDRAG
eukprot:symbB.v1.2.028062.t1/scaffold2935.1/size102186/2